MIESNFYYNESDSDRGSHRLVTKEEFLKILGDLKEMQIWKFDVQKKREGRENVSI